MSLMSKETELLKKYLELIFDEREVLENYERIDDLLAIADKKNNLISEIISIKEKIGEDTDRPTETKEVAKEIRRNSDINLSIIKRLSTLNEEILAFLFELPPKSYTKSGKYNEIKGTRDITEV